MKQQQSLQSSYQIMDRIGYVKRMISTHQKKLITEPKRSSSHMDTSHTDIIRKTRDTTSTSDYQSAQDTAGKKLLREELRLTKQLLDKRSLELAQISQDNRQLLAKLNERQEEADDHLYEMKKIVRERNDLQEELQYKMKKIDMQNEEILRLQRSEQQMMQDLRESKEALQNIKQYEQEIKNKEKQVGIHLLIDWQRMEKDKVQFKDKQQQLLLAEQQLSEQAIQLQTLKNRLEIQEKKLLSVQFQKTQQFSDIEQKLVFKEKQLNMKEVQMDQYDRQEDVEQKYKILDLNEELFKKRVNQEYRQIKEVQQKLKIIK